MQTHKE
jgi:hypothetical protein